MYGGCPGRNELAPVMVCDYSCMASRSRNQNPKFKWAHLQVILPLKWLIVAICLLGSMHVFICIYIYIYVWMHVFIYACMFLHIHTYFHTYCCTLCADTGSDHSSETPFHQQFSRSSLQYIPHWVMKQWKDQQNHSWINNRHMFNKSNWVNNPFFPEFLQIQPYTHHAPRQWWCSVADSPKISTGEILAPSIERLGLHSWDPPMMVMECFWVPWAMGVYQDTNIHYENFIKYI